MAGLSNGRRRFLLRGGVKARILFRATRARPDFSLRLPAAGPSLSFFIALLLGLLLLPAAYAQQPSLRPDPSPDEAAPGPIVSSVRFSGNDFFSDDVLALRVRTQPNRRFLNIPGLTWWLWIYRLGASGRLGRRLGRALTASGEAPAYLDAAVLQADVERLRLFYRQEGFREAQVDARVDTTAEGRRAAVTFEIAHGPPTFIRNVDFDGLAVLSPEQQLQLTRASLLRPLALDRTAPLHFKARNQRYSEPTLLEERRRVLTFLRNQGYAAVTRDSIRAIVHRPRPDSFDIVFRVRPGPRYRFGDVDFRVSGPEPAAPPRTDTFYVAPSEAATGGTVSVAITNESKLDPALLLRSLRFVPGEWYNQSELLATKRRLEATGVFAFTDLAPRPADTTASVPHLPHRIDLRTLRRHQVRVETFMLQRSGVLVGAEDELGTGVGLSYENANLLGGGEAFQVRTTGSIAANLDAIESDSARTRLFTSTQAEVSASLTFPYLVPPFGRLDRWLGLYDARSRLSFSLLTARRDELKLIIRGRGTARFRLEMQHRPTLASLVDLLDLSVSNPDTLKGFSVFLENILNPVTDPVQRAQILEDYTRPQINNALRYTLRMARVNPLRRDRGYSYDAAFEIGGNLPYLLDRLVFTPDTLEGTLPGLPFFQGDAQRDTRLLYRQYLRVQSDLRQYRPLSRNAVLAWKLIAGMAHPTGRAEVVPFDRRFYSGGATSVRGWGLRELGPGDAAPDSTGSSDLTNIRGGDIKLETSLELRNTLLRNVLAAQWLSALFIDVGNVWLGPRNPGTEGRFVLNRFYRELGVGAGVGLRIDWEYLIVRLDLAYRLYDPSLPDQRLFPPEPRGPNLHFGIGHAF